MYILYSVYIYIYMVPRHEIFTTVVCDSKGAHQNEGIVVVLMGVVQVHAEDARDDSHQRNAHRGSRQQQLQLQMKHRESALTTPYPNACLPPKSYPYCRIAGAMSKSIGSQHESILLMSTPLCSPTGRQSDASQLHATSVMQPLSFARQSTR